MAANSKTVTFTAKKETPGCVVYTEDEVAGQPPIIGTLYVKKWHAAGKAKVKVTLELIG